MTCPSRLRLDEWIAGRRPAEVAAHVGGCARCAERIAVLEAEHAAFTLRARPAAFADAVLARRHPRPWLGWLLLAATACVVVLAFFRRVPPDEAYQGYKGAPVSASLYVKQGAAVAPYDRARVYHAGDLLQIIVTAKLPAYVSVVNQEEGGKSNLLFTSEQPLPVGRTPLPRSFELDDWTGGETIVVLFGDPGLGEPIARAKRGEGERFALRRR